MADLLLALLRFAHVLAAAFWMGGAAMMLMVITPTARALPEAGGPFLRQLILQGRLARFQSANAGLTTLAGLILFWQVDATAAYPTASTGGLVFHIGAAAGFVAFLVGMAVQAPLAKRMAAAAREPGPPTPAMLVMQARFRMWGWILLTLLMVALFGMLAGSNLG